MPAGATHPVLRWQVEHWTLIRAASRRRPPVSPKVRPIPRRCSTRSSFVNGAFSDATAW